VIPDAAVVALAIRNFEAEQGDGEWDHLPESIKPGWIKEARAQCEAAAPFIAAQALDEAADESARLPYVKPDDPGRGEYERVLAVRRGDADKWLRARAAILRGPCVTG
jgi:hypothetical protein